MQVVTPLRNSKVHALQLRNRAATRLHRHQASQLHPGGMASPLSHITEERMMGDVTFFIVLMGWFGEHFSQPGVQTIGLRIRLALLDWLLYIKMHWDVVCCQV